MYLPLYFMFLMHLQPCQLVAGFVVHNLCERHHVTSSHGYIATPNYPDASYYSDTHCGCHFSTSDAHLLLHILDFAVNHTLRTRCDGDFLRIGRRGRKCGVIGAAQLPQRMRTMTSQVSVEFFADRLNEARGVWLEYTGWCNDKYSCGQD